MKDLQFGVEIETVGLTRRELAQAIHAVVAGPLGQPMSGSGIGGNISVTDARGREWRVVYDGSLSSGEYSGEIVTPILHYEDLELLHRVIRAVAEKGARADESTGIHIHVGASRFDAQSLARLVKMVHKQERLLEHALGISPGRLSRYCKPIDADFIRMLEAGRPRTLQAVNRAWYGRLNQNPQRYDQTRYHGINLNSFYLRGTIEFRYFNGTVDADKVKAYVQFVLALAAKALASKGASSKRRDFNVETAKYDWRVFLLSLGLIGDEFKTARKHLTQHLAGSAAWKGARRDRKADRAGRSAAPVAAELVPVTTASEQPLGNEATAQRDPQGREEAHDERTHI